MTYYTLVCSKTNAETTAGMSEEERFTSCMAQLMGLPAEPPEDGNAEVIF